MTDATPWTEAEEQLASKFWLTNEPIVTPAPKWLFDVHAALKKALATLAAVRRDNEQLQRLQEDAEGQLDDLLQTRSLAVGLRQQVAALTQERDQYKNDVEILQRLYVSALLAAI